MNLTEHRGVRCVVCNEHPPLNPSAEHPTCATCRSAISRLTRLDPGGMRKAERRAVARVRRVIAAQVGVAGLVARTQRTLSERDEAS